MSFPLADKPHQILAPDGKIVGQLPDLSDDRLLGFYRWMVYGRVFSNRMVTLQRQGRMGTFAPLDGQEATSVGLATPLQKEDWLAGSYREILSYAVKGVPPGAIMETYKGHAGPEYPAETRCLPFQIVLSTQMLHAVGLAMAVKYEGKPEVVVGVCGDGATSEGDFNEALNFAAVFNVPVVMVVQNNGWAISVPRSRQTAAQYIAHRGPGFGMPGHLVDGNDVLAVYQVVSECVTRARAGAGPSLVEALTYRFGAHTTADEPKKYRPQAELEAWQARDPLPRFRQFLINQKILDSVEDEEIKTSVATEIQEQVEALESLPPPDPGRIFDLVYAEPTPQLQRQRAELMQYLGRG